MDDDEIQMEQRILNMDLFFTYQKEIPSKDLDQLQSVLKDISKKKAK